MLPSYLLSLREGIEAALIIGIVLGALRQMRRTDLSSAVWIGVIQRIRTFCVGRCSADNFWPEL